MKTKEKHGEIFRKVNELTEENEELHSTVANLTNELLRLKTYLKESGVSTNDLSLLSESQLV